MFPLYFRWTEVQLGKGNLINQVWFFRDEFIHLWKVSTKAPGIDFPILQHPRKKGEKTQNNTKIFPCSSVCIE